MKKILISAIIIIGIVYISMYLFVLGLYVYRFKIDRQILAKMDHCAGIKIVLGTIKTSDVELKEKWSKDDFNKYISLKKELKECDNKSEAEKRLKLISRTEFILGIPLLFGIGVGIVISWFFFWRKRTG